MIAAWLLACAGAPASPPSLGVAECGALQDLPALGGTLNVQAFAGPGVTQAAVLRQVSWLAEAWAPFGLQVTLPEPPRAVVLVDHPDHALLGTLPALARALPSGGPDGPDLDLLVVEHLVPPQVAATPLYGLGVPVPAVGELAETLGRTPGQPPLVVVGDVAVQALTLAAAAGVVGHEAGHALGLDHVADLDNLMHAAPVPCRGTLTPAQGETVALALGLHKEQP